MDGMFCCVMATVCGFPTAGSAPESDRAMLQVAGAGYIVPGHLRRESGRHMAGAGAAANDEPMIRPRGCRDDLNA